jgi:hypothetical protein
MTFKLEAEFAGLAAIVPPIDDKGAIVVVLVNGDNAGVGPHEPRLCIDARFVEFHEGDLPPNAYLVVPGGARMAIWHLDHRSVSIGNSADHALKHWDEENDYGDMQPGVAATRWMKSTWRDLGWVASVSKAAAGVGATKYWIYDANLKPHDPAANPRSPTHALISLHNGTLATGLPHAPLLFGEIFDFVDKDAEEEKITHSRSLSDHVTLISEQDDPFALFVTPFPYEAGTAAQTKTIHLSSRDKEVQLTFASMPSPKGHHAHGGYMVGEQNDWLKDPDYIEHFKAFYYLLPELPKDKPVPWRRGRMRAVSSSECPPALARRQGDPAVLAEAGSEGATTPKGTHTTS